MPSDSDELRRSTTRALSSLLDDPPAVALTTSCTHALEAAGLLLGVGPGDEVVVPAFTLSSTANAFLLRGATLRFADVDPATGNIDPNSVAERTTDRTAVVVAVHYAGVAADLPALLEQSRTLGWGLVEDAAQGLYGSLDGRALGRWGRLGAISFHRTKNVSCGEGGALVVNDPELITPADVALDKGNDRVAFDAGVVAAYQWTGLGSAWRMPIESVERLAVSLDGAAERQRRRHVIWDRYLEGLTDWAHSTGSTLPTIPDGAEHPAHIFWILLPEGASREAVREHCAARGVEVTQHYASLPTTTYGRTIAHPDDACPVAEQFAARLIRLPLDPTMDDGDLDRVLEAVTTSTR